MIRLTLLLLTIGMALQAQNIYSVTNLPRTAGIPRCAVAATDDAFVVCYRADGIGERPENGVLGVMMLNEAGVVSWNRLIDVNDDATRVDILLPTAIVRTRSGAFIVAANVIDRSSGQNVERGVLLLTLNHSGEIIAQRRYDAELFGCDTFDLPDGSRESVCRTGRIVDMIAADDGAVLLVETMGGAIVARIAEEGTMLSSRTITDAFAAEARFIWEPRAIAADSAGGLLIAGSGYRQGPSPNAPLLLHLDADGELLNAVTFPGHVDPFLNDVTTLADGRFLLTGMSTIKTRFVTMKTMTSDTMRPVGDVVLLEPRRVVTEADRNRSQAYIGQPTVWILDEEIGGGSTLVMNMATEDAWGTKSEALSGGQIVVMTSERSRAENSPFKEGYATLAADGTYLSYSAITPFARIAPQRLDGTVYENEARSKRGPRPYGPAQTNDVAPGWNGQLLLVGEDYRLVPFLSFHRPGEAFPCMETRSVPVDTTTARFATETVPFISSVRDVGEGGGMRLVEISREVGLVGICEPIEE